MVYGSEAVAGVAAQLTRGMGWNVQTLLLTSGTPTVFAVDVPCSAVSGETLTEVTKAILEELGCEADKEPSIIDFTLAPGRALPADSIVRYYSVHRLHDPILWQEYVHRPGSLATIPTR